MWLVSSLTLYCWCLCSIDTSNCIKLNKSVSLLLTHSKITICSMYNLYFINISKYLHKKNSIIVNLNQNRSIITQQLNKNSKINTIHNIKSIKYKWSTSGMDSKTIIIHKVIKSIY